MIVSRLLYNSIDSTNLEAKRHWDQPQVRREAASALQSGKRAAWVFIASEQTAGRGRLGRSWTSPLGGLWFSLLWPMDVDPARLQGVPLAVGVAVAEAIEEQTGLKCSLKWPNDVLFHGKKLAGLLCELEVRGNSPALIVGVGINANFPATQLSLDASHPVTTLLDEAGPADLESLLDRTLKALFLNLREFETGGLARFLGSIHQRLAWIDSAVILTGSEAGDVRGVLSGIDAVGRVVLDCQGQVRSFMTGELRPARC